MLWLGALLVHGGADPRLVLLVSTSRLVFAHGGQGFGKKREEKTVVELEGTWSPSCLDLKPMRWLYYCLNAPLNRSVWPEAEPKWKLWLRRGKENVSAEFNNVQFVSSSQGLEMLWLARDGVPRPISQHICEFVIFYLQCWLFYGFRCPKTCFVSYSRKFYQQINVDWHTWIKSSQPWVSVPQEVFKDGSKVPTALLMEALVYFT